MGLNTTQQYYLQKMGIDVYVPRFGNADVVAPEAGQVQAPVVDTGVHQPEWESLRKQVAACTKCELHRGRTQTVFGVGNVHADWMIIGEAPGRDEDLQGEPFVGRAGKLLNAMLRAIGLQREQVYIANILKCRPPNNRDPRPEEVICCEGYLRQQIDMIKPKIILAVGRIAAQNLLKVETPIGQMRGNRYEYPHHNIPVVVTYHPAYLLRSPREKRKSWQDLQFAMKIYHSRI
jgi:DNA polymerase